MGFDHMLKKDRIKKKKKKGILLLPRWDGQRLVAELGVLDLSRPFHVGVPESLSGTTSWERSRENKCRKQRMGKVKKHHGRERRETHAHWFKGSLSHVRGLYNVKLTVKNLC